VRLKKQRICTHFTLSIEADDKVIASLLILKDSYRFLRIQLNQIQLHPKEYFRLLSWSHFDQTENGRQYANSKKKKTLSP